MSHHLLRSQKMFIFFAQNYFSFEQGENLTLLVPTVRDSPMSALAAFSLSDMTDTQSRRVEGPQSLDNKDLELKDKLNNKDLKLKDKLNNGVEGQRPGIEGQGHGHPAARVGETRACTTSVVSPRAC